jgi:NADH-quinone oxidoreductase subunit L
LGAGSVIHAVHSNDVWQMGGLKKYMPVTHVTFLIATLAISGVWPFAGFFSKDEILMGALVSGHWIVFGVALAVAALTAFYMFRIYILTFLGEGRSPSAHHAHESNWIMLTPLVILSIYSIGAGFVDIPKWVYFGAHQGHAAHGIGKYIWLLGSLAAAIGISLSFLMYARKEITFKTENVARRLGFVYVTVKNKFYIDEVYLFVTRKIIFRMVSLPIAWFDRVVVDGSMNSGAWVSRVMSFGITERQNGKIQGYLFWEMLGVLLLMILIYGLA